MTLSGTTTPGQSGPWNEEGVLCIPQISCNTGTSPSDCIASYPRHTLEESYLSAEIQSVYSIVPADWSINRIWDIYHRNLRDVLCAYMIIIFFYRNKTSILMTHNLIIYMRTKMIDIKNISNAQLVRRLQLTLNCLEYIVIESIFF